MFLRIDKSSIIKKIDVTSEGYLSVVAPIARTGVYNYILPNGELQREYIPPTTLFNQDSINTLQLKPVTNDHPSTFVDTDSYKELSVGSVGETIHKDGDKLFAKFMVTDSEAIDDVNDGKLQLSPAYTCDLDFTAGVTPDGEKYDAIQINRVYNHLAIVDKARGGNELNFKVDSDSNIAIQTDNNLNQQGNSEMKNSIRIDGVDHAVDNEAIVSHIATLNQKVDGLETDLDKEKAEGVTLTAKLDSAKEEIASLKADASSDEDVTARVDAKLALINTARTVLGEDGVKTTDSDEAIMKAVVLKVAPKAKLDSYEGDEKAIYLKARFDSAVESFSEDEDEMAEQRRNLNKNDGEQRKDARAEFDKKRSERWKGKK